MKRVNAGGVRAIETHDWLIITFHRHLQTGQPADINSLFDPLFYDSTLFPLWLFLTLCTKKKYPQNPDKEAYPCAEF
jgi:hypothetical protein